MKQPVCKCPINEMLLSGPVLSKAVCKRFPIDVHSAQLS